MTPREIECLRWCSKGKTNWEIGQILNLSERTVEHYVGSALKKLGATTRAQAVAMAMRIGRIGKSEEEEPPSQ